jgi:hypothetical protein
MYNQAHVDTLMLRQNMHNLALQLLLQNTPLRTR